MCVQHDPIDMRRFEEEPGDDQPVAFGTYKSEAARALTKTFQDEEQDDE